MNTICVYCGSSDHIPEHYLQAAREMGAALASRGIRLVYGGGRTGMMGVLADAALGNGGQVIGVIPEMFHNPQLAHTGLTSLEVVADMHRRKSRMAELADAFIALPGGFGTLEEVFETITWSQIGLHRKPVGLLNTAGYFNPLVAMIRKARDQGFIYREHQDLITIAPEVEVLLAALDGYQPPEHLDRWVNRP